MRPRIRRHAVTSTPLGLAAVLLTAVTVSAAFGPTLTLRTAPAGRDVLVGDVAGRGQRGIVVWQDEGAGSGATPRIRYRLTTDGGDGFGSLELLDTRDSMEPRADVCAGYAWVTYALHTKDADPAETEIVLAGHRFGQAEAGYGALMTDPFVYDEAHVPDVACVGNRRHIVGWVDEMGLTDAVHLRLPAIFGDIFEPPPDYTFGPYAGHTSGGLAVAATSSMAYAAWIRLDLDAGEEELRFKRFGVGPGPDSIVTSYATTSPSPFDVVRSPRLAAAGSTVVLAFVRGNDFWVQVSTDSGASFAPARRVINGPPDFATELWSVTVRGSRIVVEATQLYGDVSGGVIDPTRASSTNGGSTWTVQHPHGTGARLGVIVAGGPGGGPHLWEAWDERFSEAAADRIRFHAEQ